MVVAGVAGVARLVAAFLFSLLVLLPAQTVADETVPLDVAERERLEPASKELQRLRKTREAAEQHSQQAGTGWRKGFLDGFGVVDHAASPGTMLARTTEPQPPKESDSLNALSISSSLNAWLISAS